MSTTANGRIDATAVKSAAAGRWAGILSALGIDAAVLDGRHHPCPRCGGTDRFRAFDDFESSGGAICNQCFQTGADGIATVKWLLDCDFNTAINTIADQVGITGNGQAQPVDIVADVSRRKRVPLESFKRFGAHAAMRGKLEVCRLPMYGPLGEHCSDFDLSTIDEKWLKGIAAKGKPAGLFLPDGRIPESGLTLITEGCKDAAALDDQGFQAVGLPRAEMGAEFARLFRGLDVVIVPDRDAAGEKGAKLTASRLAGVAQSVRIATLPAELKEAGGDGVREILAKRDGARLLKQAIDDAVEWAPGDAIDDPEAGERFKFLTGPELMAGDFKVDWLIEGILAKGQPGGIMGGFKTLKTLTTLDLLLSLASGGHFLGYFPVARACRVAFMSGESGLASLQDGARRIAQAGNFEPSENFLVTTELPQLGDPIDIEHIRQLIDHERLEVLVIDPFYLAADLGDDATNVFKSGKFLRPLAKLCNETGCTIIIVHHNRKHAANTGEPADLSDCAGAGIAEFVRQWLIVSRREKYDSATPGDHRLWLTVGGSAGHSGLYGLDVFEGSLKDPYGRVWEVDVKTGADVRDAAQRERETSKDIRQRDQLEADRETILATMDKFPDGETKTSIRDTSGLSGRRFAPAFADLLGRREIEEFGQIAKGNGRGYPGFRRIGPHRSASVRNDADGRNGHNGPHPPMGGGPLPVVSSPDLDGSNGPMKADGCDPRIRAAREAFPE